MRRPSFFALAAILLSAIPAQAQAPQALPPDRPGQEGPHRHGGGDLQKLGLTGEQRRQLREIRERYPDDPKARRKAAEEILTPEQREKLKELRRHRRELRRAPQGAPPQP